MNTFSLFVGVSIILGLSWAVSGLKDKNAYRLIDSSLGILLGGLVGGRVGYVAVHWSYYQAHSLEIPQVWAGGLSAVGALWGGFLVWLLYAFLKIQAPVLLADQFFPVLMLIVVAVWLGGWVEGVAYGQLVDEAWFGLPARDEWGVFSRRFPTQLIGATLTVGWFWFLETRRRRWLPGWLAAWGLLGVSAVYTGMSFLRADPARLWLGLRLETWGGFSLLILALFCMILRWRVKKP